jgi:hypothetical protein
LHRCLQYQYFLMAQFFADIIIDICIFGSSAISWR